jgi:hypothetical protein
MITIPDRRAEQLTNAIAWFWTIYSAAVLVVLSSRSLPSGHWSFCGLVPIHKGLFISTLLVLPSLLLIGAYLQALEVRNPKYFDIDPCVPKLIEMAHRKAAKQKMKALNRANLWTAGAACSVILAILSTLWLITPANIQLDGQLGRQGSPPELLLNGTFPKNLQICFQVATIGEANRSLGTYDNFPCYSSPTGELQTSLRGVPISKSYKVIATWNEEKATKSITIDVKGVD